MGLYSWISDGVRPGVRMHQLHLMWDGRSEGSLTQFPTDYENYTGAQVRAMYDTIETVRDFEGFVRIQRESGRREVNLGLGK